MLSNSNKVTRTIGSASVVNNAPGSTTAMSFPGTTGSYVQINSSQASPIGNNLFIEAWVYFNSIGSTAQTIFSMGSVSTEYMSIKVADAGGPEIAGPFTCSLTNGDGTVTTSSAIGRSFTNTTLYYNIFGDWLVFNLPQAAQYWSSFQFQIYITKLAGTPAMSQPDVFVQADFQFDLDGFGNWVNIGTVDLLPFGTTWPAGAYNTTYTWTFPPGGIPTILNRDNPTAQTLYRFRVRGGGVIDGNFYEVWELLDSNQFVPSGTYNDFKAQANQWNHLAFTWSNGSKTLSSFCNGMWVKTQNQTSAAPLFSEISSIGASNAGTATPFNGYIRNLRIVRGANPPEGDQDNLYYNPNFVPDQTFVVGTVPSYVPDGTNVFTLLPFTTPPTVKMYTRPTPTIVTTNLALYIKPVNYPGSGTSITDSSGNGRTFTFGGTPLPTYVASPVPAFSFIRNSDVINYNRLYINSNFLGDDMTLQAWISTSNVGASQAHYTLMYVMGAEQGGPGNDWGFGVDQNGKLAFGAGPNDVTIATTNSVNTGTWINIAATRTKIGGAIALYINGVLNGSGTSNAGNSLTSSSSIWIGSGQDGPAYTFGGLIGEILAYTSVLSADAILINYNITRTLYGV